MQRADGGVAGEGLNRRVVAQQRGGVGVPQVAGHPLVGRQPGEAGVGGVGLPIGPAQRPVPAGPAEADAQQVAGAQLGALGRHHGLQLLHGDGPGVEGVVGQALPGLPTGQVHQHSPAGHPVLGPPVDPQAVGALGRVLGAAPVVAPLPAADVAQGVPLGGGLEVEVVEPVVHLVAAQGEHVVLVGLAAEQGRVGLGERQVERDHLARADEGGGRRHPLRGHQVDRAQLVVGAPHLPGVAQAEALQLRQVVELGQVAHWCSSGAGPGRAEPRCPR